MQSEDISQKEFGSSLRGLNQEEVYTFLESVAQEWAQKEREDGRLRGELGQLKERLRAYEEKEQALNQTLAAIERNRGETQELAKREAELIRSEARLEAEQMLQHAESRRQLALEEIRTLETLYARLRARLKGVLDTFDDLLKSPEELREEFQSTTRPDRPRPTGPSEGS